MATSPRRQDIMNSRIQNNNNPTISSQNGPPGLDDEVGAEPVDRTGNTKRGDATTDMLGRLSIQDQQQLVDDEPNEEDEEEMIEQIDSLEVQLPDARRPGDSIAGRESRKAPPVAPHTQPAYTNSNNFSNNNNAKNSQATAASKALSSLTKQASQQPGNMKQQQQPQQVFESNEGEDEEFPEEDEDEGSGAAASDDDGSWISWFCSLRGNEFFCEVDEDYIQDDFNLTGLSTMVPYYDYALDMVLDVEMPMEDSLTEEQQEIMESAAEMLYGLIHARFIITSRGMHAMYEKYRLTHFGRCPAVFCQGQPLLPVGLSDLPRNYTVNVFCPRCHGLFFPKSTRQANIDGAYFGTTFPHLYLMTHPDMIPAKPSQIYQPRVYGFRVNELSLYYQNREEDRNNAQKQENNSRTSRRARRQAGTSSAAGSRR